MLSIESGSAVLLQALAGASLRALVLAAIAGVGLWAWRGRTAPVQHAVWTVVAVAMLLLLLGPLLPPVVPLPAEMDVSRWLRVPAEAAASTIPVGAAGLPIRSEPIVIAIDSRGGLWMDAVGPRVVWGWMSVVAAVYLAGLAAMLGHLAMGSFFAGRLVGRSAPVREERLKEAMDAVAREQAAPMPWPEVLESGDVLAPVVVGRRAPAIILPAGWREWDDWKLRAVLAHELAHVRRGDGRTVVLAAWSRAVFWFHPLAWWVERRLAALCEQACDDAAVRTVGDAPRYAQVLLEIAAAGPGLRIRTAISMAGVSHMGRRIERLLAGGSWSTGLAPWRVWAGMALGTLPVVMFLALAQAREPMADPGDVRRGWNWQEDGFRTTAEEARELERQIAREPGALGLRAKLMAYYLYNADFAAGGSHVLWVIANRPESELAASAPTMGTSLMGLGAPGETEQLVERTRQLWKEQAARHGGDVRMLGNAAAALNWTEPEEAERLLLRARELDRENDNHWVGRLAGLYAQMVAQDYYMRAGMGSMGGRLNLDGGIGERVRERLLNGTDQELAGRVGAAVAGRLVHSRMWVRGKEREMQLAQRAMGEFAQRMLVQASVGDAARWAPLLAELRAWLRSEEAKQPG